MTNLPYPRYNESHDAWMRRCDDWESQRNRSRHSHAEWTSGRPSRQGIEHYSPPICESLPDGSTVQVVRRGFGNQAARRVEAWARKHGHAFSIIRNANGCHGKYSRTDGIAFLPLKP